MSYSMRVYVRTLAVAAICLFTIYASCFLCFAEDVPAGDTPETKTSDTVEDVSPEESEIPEQSDEEPLPEDAEPSNSETSSEIEESSSIEENPAGDGGIGVGSESDVEPNNSDTDSVDTGGDVYSVAEDVHAIRQYTEFFIFGVIPLSVAVCFIIAGCIWFRKIFIRM